MERSRSSFRRLMWSRTAGDERGPAGGAGLLAVVVGEDRALVGDAVEVGRAIAHLAAVVGADVPVADIIAHDDDDVGLLLRLLGRNGRDHGGGERREQAETSTPDDAHGWVPSSWRQVGLELA